LRSPNGLGNGRLNPPVVDSVRSNREEEFRRRLRVWVFGSGGLAAVDADGGGVEPRRIEAYSSNAATAALVRVELKAVSTRPMSTRFVVRTGATFQRLRTKYFEEDVIATLCVVPFDNHAPHRASPNRGKR